jgi:hypothetical protein
VLDRVAVAQRYPQESEFVFSTDTDTTEIDLNDAFAVLPGQAGSSAFAPITIAPDWEELPAGTKFRLYVQGSPRKPLGTGPWTRVFPADLLAQTNQPFYSSQPRTVNLTYQAYVGLRVVANASVGLTFAPNSKVLQGVGPAPTVPSVVTGATIPVAYDISNVNPAFLKNPSLTVSYPGRMGTWTAGSPGYKQAYSVPITQLKGTIEVPVSALQGDGVYGIAVALNTWPNILGDYDGALGPNAPVTTTWAYTRVATTSARPSAPVLSYQGDANFPAESGHGVDVTYNHPFTVNWDVNDIKGANGATLEISAAGPSLYGSYNLFNNPNGSEPDANGVDTGETYTLSLAGTRGSMLVNPWPSIDASQYYTVRVFATAGGKIVGEGGDVSTIATHGIIPSDGGNLLGGFGVNQAGTSGVLTSNQLDSTNRVDSSIEIFDPQGLLINYTLDAASSDSGTYPGSLRVPMFNLNGFGVDPNGSVYVAADNAQWFYYPSLSPTYGASTLKYVANPQLEPTDPAPICGICITITQPQRPYLAQTNYLGVDYLLGDMGTGASTYGWSVTPATYGNGLNLGTPIPMPNPLLSGSVFQFPACLGLAAGNGFGIGGFVGEDQANTVLQTVALPNGQASAAIPLSDTESTTCNLTMVGSSVATDAIELGSYQGVLDVTPISGASGSGGTPTDVPIMGYIPVTLTELQGTQIDGWALMSALSPDYLTNDNATSTLTIVNQYGFDSEYWTPFGDVDNIPIATNNRLSAGAVGGILYLIGAGGNEIAPFPSGL